MYYLVVIGEDVYNQRFLSFINKLNGLIDTAHCDDGQQRSKDLLLHHFGFTRHILQHSRGCRHMKKVTLRVHIKICSLSWKWLRVGDLLPATCLSL